MQRGVSCNVHKVWFGGGCAQLTSLECSLGEVIFMVMVRVRVRVKVRVRNESNLPRCT